MPDVHGPYRNMRFIVELEGIVIAGFVECHIPERRADVIRYREGNDPPTPRKLAGLNRYGRLVLETGLTDTSMALYEWQELVRQGKVDAARRPAAIILLDAEGSAAARWELERAWPVTYRAPDLDAMGEDVAVETLEIVCERIERVSPAAPDGSGDSDDTHEGETDDSGQDDADQERTEVQQGPRTQQRQNPIHGSDGGS